jgi:hypothetical protein
MLIRAYLPQILAALFGGLFVAAGIFTFGNALLFDRLFLGVIVFTAILCRKEINIVAALAIILLQHLFEEIAWLYLPNYDIANIPIYLAALWFSYYFWYDWVSKILLINSILAICAEVYWHLTGYSAPSIAWYLGLMIVCLVVRHFVFIRVGFVDLYFSDKGKSINLDWILYKINAFVVLTQTIVLYEYFARHILGYSNALLAYNYSAYLIHGLSTLIIWAAFSESYRQLIPKQLKA